MTTIAVSRKKNGKGVLVAADTQITSGYSRRPGYTKVFHPGGKTTMLCGAAGDVRISNILKHVLKVPDFTARDHADPEKWLVTKLSPAIAKAVEKSGAMGKDENRDDVAMNTVIIIPGAVAYLGGDLSVYGIHQDFWAVGSGSDFAIGAMSAGAKADKAVAVAGQHDLYTNNEVMTWGVKW